MAHTDPVLSAAPQESGQVDVRGLSKTFGTVKAVDGLSFSVAAGTVTGFLGPTAPEDHHTALSARAGRPDQ